MSFSPFYLNKTIGTRVVPNQPVKWFSNHSSLIPALHTLDLDTSEKALWLHETLGGCLDISHNNSYFTVKGWKVVKWYSNVIRFNLKLSTSKNVVSDTVNDCFKLCCIYSTIIFLLLRILRWSDIWQRIWENAEYDPV